MDPATTTCCRTIRCCYCWRAPRPTICRNLAARRLTRLSPIIVRRPTSVASIACRETCDIGAAEHQPGVFNFQIQSALAALSTPDPGGSVTATLEPTEPPEPTEIPSTCLSLPSHVVVSNVTNSTQCKVVDEGGVGNQTLIDGGIYSALDIFGYLPSAIKVCFKHHTGAAVLLDAATSPRSIVPLFTWTRSR